MTTERHCNGKRRNIHYYATANKTAVRCLVTAGIDANNTRAIPRQHRIITAEELLEVVFSVQSESETEMFVMQSPAGGGVGEKKSPLLEAAA
jgi:hypothetical protein